MATEQPGKKAASAKAADKAPAAEAASVEAAPKKKPENPAAKTFQAAIFKQGIAATVFFTDDIQKEYQRLKKLGVRFTMQPTKTPGSRAQSTSFSPVS